VTPRWSEIDWRKLEKLIQSRGCYLSGSNIRNIQIQRLSRRMHRYVKRNNYYSGKSDEQNSGLNGIPELSYD
jgi:hypothetical protein